MADINKAGVLIIRENRFLLCRKIKGTNKLILPGGGIESGETPQDCIIRETHEELGANVQIQRLKYLGTYEDKAAFDDPSINKTVQIILFQGNIKGNPVPSSEISEILWFGPDSETNQLSEIIKNKILPDLVLRKIVNW
jgi:8-oxo-dGTP pyrophosphatase MutT (NUDIX family)